MSRILRFHATSLVSKGTFSEKTLLHGTSGFASQMPPRPPRLENDMSSTALLFTRAILYTWRTAVPATRENSPSMSTRQHAPPWERCEL